jgi:glycosylphosphatidylinositol transamidase (GPIT) subunit GPI8
MEDEEEYNQFDEVSFFVDTTRTNIIATKIYYSNVCSIIRSIILDEL